MNHVTQPLNFADISTFSPETSKFCYIKKYRHRLYVDTYFLILLTYFESLRIFLIKIVAILMSAKMATLSLPKITVFWKKGYGVIIFVHVTNQILLQEFDQKNHFSEGWSWIKFNNLELALGMALILQQCDKKVKTKSQKVLRANSYICKLQGKNW